MLQVVLPALRINFIVLPFVLVLVLNTVPFIEKKLRTLLEFSSNMSNSLVRF